jgi:hypothetical protein
MPSAGRSDPSFGSLTIADIDGDGTDEIIVPGDTYTYCSPQITVEQGLFVFNKNRTRFVSPLNPLFNWQNAIEPINAAGQPNANNKLGLPVPNIEQTPSSIVTADIDGDNVLEIFMSA